MAAKLDSNPSEAEKAAAPAIVGSKRKREGRGSDDANLMPLAHGYQQPERDDDAEGGGS